LNISTRGYKIIADNDNDKLKFEIEIVHDLSCHPIFRSWSAAGHINRHLIWQGLICVGLQDVNFSLSRSSFGRDGSNLAERE